MSVVEFINELTKIIPDKGRISDGYHSFDDLYEHRTTLYVALCRQLASKYTVWRSFYHSDGSEYNGWFILGIGTKEGEQITYHLPMSWWEICDFAKEHFKAPDFDGHTSEDVLKRLLEL